MVAGGTFRASKPRDMKTNARTRNGSGAAGFGLLGQSREWAIALVVLLGLSSISNVQADTPHFGWAKSGGGTDNDQGNAIAVDASGYSYVAGFFRSLTATFG